MPAELVRTAVFAAFLAFCRIGACFMIMPGLGSARVPIQVRLFVSVAISLALLANLWSTIAPHVTASADTMFLLVLSELLTGALIGIIARFYILALQFIGAAASMLIGLGGTGGGPAIEDNDQQPALAALISFAALMLLFTLNFHHEIIRALVASYRIVPVDGLFSAQSALVDLTDTISDSFMVVLRLGSPFIAYAILVNLATGFVNKLTPQIPIYFISLPFVITGGMFMVYFGISTLLTLFADGFIPVILGR